MAAFVILSLRWLPLIAKEILAILKELKGFKSKLVPKPSPNPNSRVAPFPKPICRFEQPAYRASKYNHSHSIFVETLPPNFPVNKLRSEFGSFGMIVDVYIPNRATRRSGKFYGFVSFLHKKDGEKVIQYLNGVYFEGNLISGSWAKFHKGVGKNRTKGNFASSNLSKWRWDPKSRHDGFDSPVRVICDNIDDDVEMVPDNCEVENIVDNVSGMIIASRNHPADLDYTITITEPMIRVRAVLYSLASFHEKKSYKDCLLNGSSSETLEEIDENVSSSQPAKVEDSHAFSAKNCR